MASMAAVTLVGNLGADPEFTDTRAKLRVAVNTRRSGQKVTTWYDVTVWGKQAEFLAERVANGEVRRGSTVLVQGEIEARPWVGKDGKERVSLDVNASKVLAIGSASEESQEGSGTPAWGAPPF
jgi:single-strand DNA-binding protein